jgi:ABC-type proline/glycine betaine transport system substrate-binding protein
MQKLKIHLKIAVVIFLFVISLFSCTGPVENEVPKNIIYLIGDGMGFAQVTATEYAHGNLNMTSTPFAGSIFTHSANSRVTDSASSATALSAGYKTNNGMLGMLPDGTPVQTIAQYASEIGKSTALLASCRITHATPAGFAVHHESRGDEFIIAEKYLDSGIDMLLGGIDGWEVTEINRYKLHAYGLDDAYNFQSAGSAAAFDAAIVSQIDRGEPVLFYYWTPAWIPGVYDLVQLEEPAWNEECQAALDAALEAELAPAEAGEDVGCELPSGSVEMGVFAGLEESAPEMVEVMRNIDGFGTDLMNELTAYMELEAAEPDEAALWFFGQYPDVWRAWIADDDARERVEEALRERGVDV